MACRVPAVAWQLLLTLTQQPPTPSACPQSQTWFWRPKREIAPPGGAKAPANSRCALHRMLPCRLMLSMLVDEQPSPCLHAQMLAFDASPLKGSIMRSLLSACIPLM